MVDKCYKYCPSEEKWEMAKKIQNFLLSFYDITTLISGTSYPTSNLYDLIENVKDGISSKKYD